MRWETDPPHVDYLDVLHPLLETGKASHHGEVWSCMGSGGRPTEAAAEGDARRARGADARDRRAPHRWHDPVVVGPRREAPDRAVINAAAAFADRPAPSVVCSLPVWVTDDPGPAREFVAAVLKDYTTLPSYRAMLDVEGVNGVADISLIGSEEVVAEGIERIAAAGATDFTTIVMGGNPDERSRTVAALTAAAIVE